MYRKAFNRKSPDKKMRIVFLSPPQKDKNFPSLGIAYLTSILNKNNHQAFLHDGVDSSIKKMIRYIERISPQIVGITMNTTNRFDALELAKIIKY